MFLEIIILILAIPVGFFIAWLTKEELKAGRKYFRALIIISVLGIIGSWLYGASVLAWTFGFILIVSFISFWKSYSKK